MGDDSVSLTVTLGGDAASDMARVAAAVEAAAKAEAAFAKSVKEAADAKEKAAKFGRAVEQELERRAPAPKKTADQAAYDAALEKKRAEHTQKLVQFHYDRLTPKEPPKTQQQLVSEAATKKQEAGAFEKALKEEMERREPTHVKSRREQINEAAAKQIEGKKFGDEVAKQVAAANRTAGGTAASIAGGARTLAAGGGAVGLLGKLGPWGMAAAAALQAFEAGVQKATTALNIQNSAMHSQAQKNQMIADELIPLHKTMREFAEAIDGTTERINRAKLSAERHAVTTAGAAAGLAETRSFEFQNWQPAEAMVRAAGRPRGALGDDRFDRSTARGQRAYEENLPVQAAQDQARRDELAAKAAAIGERAQGDIKFRALASRDRAKADYEAALAKVAANKAEEDRTGHGNKARRVELVTEAQKKQATFDAAQSQYQVELERHAGTGVKAAEAEAQARRANLDVMKAELDILKQKEQRMAGFAQKLGAMNESDFEMAKASLQMVKESGIENVPAEIADEAARVAPEFIAKQREALGAKRAKGVADENRGIDDSLVNAFQKETLEQVRAQVDKVAVNVRVQMDLDAEKTAEAITASLGPLLKQFTDAIKVRVDKIGPGFDLGKAAKFSTDG